MSPAHSKLHALLIGVDCYLSNELPEGVTYPSLRGAVYDVGQVEEFLRLRLGVPPERILKLTASHNPKKPGQPAEPRKSWPTYENMVAAFKALLDRADPGDQAYIHFSGHGGRAATIHPGLKGKAGLDEALVPVDIGWSSARYLRDVELACLLRKMVDKGLVVTVALDSCHSGGATRGAGRAVPRGIAAVDTAPRRTDSDVADPAELAAAWSALPGKRNIKPASGWLLETEGYVLLAACRASEAAYEYPFDGVRPRGTLTYWMLDALSQLGANLTYRMLHQRILARIHSQFASQTPQVQGESDRVVFGVDRIPLPDPRITVLAATRSNVMLNAGRAHGLKAGARFAVYPAATADLARHAERLALAEADKVGSVSLRARITQRLVDAPIEPGAQAALLNAGDIQLSRSVRLIEQGGLPPAVDEQAALAAARAAIEQAAAGWVALLDERDAGPVEFQVAVNRGGEYEIWDPAGAALTLRPPLRVDAAGAAEALAKRLVHLTQYRNVQAIANPDGRSPLAGKLIVAWAGRQAGYARGDKPAPQPFGDAGNTPAIQAGEHAWLRIRNALPRAPGDASKNTLNIAALDLSPDWAIAQFYPRRSAFEPLNAGEEKLLPLKTSLPRGYRDGIDVIKVFATVGDQTTSFEWLALPALDQPGARGTARQAGTPLEKLFAALATGRPAKRNVQLGEYPSEEWTTAQVELRVEV
jgi:hypothetical protein